MKNAHAFTLLFALTTASVPALAAEPAVAPITPASRNEAIHVVQRKTHPFAGRFEASILGAAQVNGKFTDHLGTAGQFTYHFHENFAVLADGVFYPYTRTTQFADELHGASSLVAQAANQLLIKWQAGIGVEMSPAYGKFAFYSGSLAQFAIYIRAGGGLGDTRLRLDPPGSTTAAVYGDTGLKFVGTLGLGVRVYLTRRVALRVEVRDQVLTARISEVNGCDARDLEALSASGADASVKSGCNKAAFPDPRRIAGPSAQLIEKPTSDVINNVGAFLGLSLLF